LYLLEPETFSTNLAILDFFFSLDLTSYGYLKKEFLWMCRNHIFKVKYMRKFAPTKSLFFFQFYNAANCGDHSQVDSAKFGYLRIWKEKLKHPSIFSASYSCIEIWGNL
jgi:hypothetical protein